MIVDERDGLPSCSAFDRIYACPGSASIPTEVATSSADAERGTLIHSELELWLKSVSGDVSQDLQQLSEPARKCAVQIREVLALYNFVPTRWIVEQRMWIYDGLKKVASGKADIIIDDGERLMVIDYKTGRGNVPHPSRNHQIRGLAVAANDAIGPRRQVIGVIIQPDGFPYGPQCAVFDEDDLVQIRQEIDAGLLVARDGNAPRQAGGHCKYCPHKPSCPEHLLALSLSAPIGPIVPSSMGAWLDACAMAQSIIDFVKDEAKKMTEAGVEIAGYKLVGGGTTKKIEDIAGAVAALQNTPHGNEALQSALTLSYTALVASYATHHNLSKPEATEALSLVLGEIVKVTPRAKSLKRIK